MATVEERIAALEEGLAQYQTDLDTVWVLLTATLVFFMQAGFALVEAGSVQQKNITNILLKNVVDVAIGSVVFYLVGFGFAFGDDGDNGFIGDRYFALSDLNDEDSSQSWAYFFFQLTFAATSATIVSGSVAERCRMSSYLVYTTAISGFIYPVVAHWVWSSTGWLSAFKRDGDYFITDVGFIDFAGSGVVHMVGGACGLMGALIIGPRLGRFQKGKLFSGKIHGHNIAYSALGTFILWTGWYGFNPGSTLLATGVSHIAARCAVTTTISAGTASMCTLAIGVCWSLWVEKEFVIDISLSLNGILAGLVGITSSCAVVQPWAALIIGVVSAFVYFFSAKLLELLKIDDPVDAAPIHFFCGMWGVLAVGFFAWEGFVEETYRPTNDYGVFVGSDSGRQLGVQIVGTIAIAAWSLSLSGALFLALRILGMLRVPASVEISGLDEDHHGGSGYDMKGATGSVIQRTTGFTSNSVLEEKVMKKLDRFWSSKKDEDEGVEMQQTRRKGGAKQQKDEEGSNSLSDEENPRRAIEERGSMIHRGQI